MPIEKVFISVVSSEQQYVVSLTSCFELHKRPGDQLFIEHRTRGDVARESMLDAFLKDKQYDAMLCLDADQRHPKDMLERLRSHDLDMVCAHYYRRGGNPIQSLCYELGDGTYPFLPILRPPTEGLHEIAITGLGCVLIKRKVLEAVQSILPEGSSPFAIGPLPEEANDHANWGSDFRFFMLARKLGYKLYLDASLESRHATIVWLNHEIANKLKNNQKWADSAHDLLQERIKLHGMTPEAYRQRKRILEARLEDLFTRAEPLKGDPERIKELQELSIAIYKMTGKIEENEAYIEWATKYPPIITPEQLPTTENTPAQNHQGDWSQSQLKEERDEMYRQNAMDIINMMPLKGEGRR